MAYTTPTTASGQVLTSAIWNASVRDNLEFLYDYGPDRARAEVSHNTTQSIANNAFQALVFNTEGADAFAMHTASGSRLTVPAGWDGWWLFTASCEFAANATGQRNLLIQTNGGSNYGWTRVDAAAAGATQLNGSAVIRLSAAGYVECFVLQNSGGALNVSASATFSAVWLANL